MPSFRSFYNFIFDEIISRIIHKTRHERILLLHMSKTGGTSLRVMLENEFGSRFVYPGTYYLKQFSNGKYPLEREILDRYQSLPKHNVLVGHFTSGIIDLLPIKYKTATFLRDPIQRSLSALAHFSRTRNVNVSRLICDQKFLSAHITNYQTRILGSLSSSDSNVIVSADEYALGGAIRFLGKMDFVGITERFEESCIVFDHVFNTQISKTIIRKNVLRPIGNELSEHIPIIQDLVQLDIILYENTLNMFNENLTLKTSLTK
jgi:hypothetical protein